MMTTKMTLFILLFSIGTSALAANDFLVKEKRPEDLSTKDLISEKEKYLFNDSLLTQKDGDTGLISDEHYTALDGTIFSAAYTLSLDPADITKSQGYEFSLMNKINDYEQLWWGIQFRIATAKYNAIADERVNGGSDPNSVALVSRKDNQQQFTIAGLGVGHRFKTYSKLFNSHRFFEMIQVYGNYIIHKDTTNEKEYKGFGYTANYNLHYRMSNSLFFGFKLSYTYANVEREKEAQESLQDRSLVFGWTNMGLEMGYFF